MVLEPHTYVYRYYTIIAIHTTAVFTGVSVTTGSLGNQRGYSLTTKPQKLDMNTVKTTVVAKTSVSPTVVTSGPRVSNGAFTLNGSADLAAPPRSMPTSLSQERITPSAQHLPPSSVSPRQPLSTQPSSLGDGGQSLSSSAGSHPRVFPEVPI